MDHKQRTFQFADNTQKVVELKSKKYNFKIEEVLTNRFGKEILDEFAKSHKLNFNLQLEHVIEDMPKLLKDIPENFNWDEVDYEDLLSVYFFFITYKENAFLREIEKDKQMLALLTAAMKETLDSAQKTILKSDTLINTPSTS